MKQMENIVFDSMVEIESRVNMQHTPVHTLLYGVLHIMARDRWEKTLDFYQVILTLSVHCICYSNSSWCTIFPVLHLFERLYFG